MWEYIGAMGPLICRDAIAAQDILNARPGGIVRVKSPNDYGWLSQTLQGGRVECYGCGAPLKSYIHHCEYCRRPS